MGVVLIKLIVLNPPQFFTQKVTHTHALSCETMRIQIGGECLDPTGHLHCPFHG